MKVGHFFPLLLAGAESRKVNPFQQSYLHDASGLDAYEKPEDVIAASPLLTLHKLLCQVPSVSGNEAAVGEVLVSFLEAHNFTVTTQSVPPTKDKKRYNIYATPDPSKYTSNNASFTRKPGPKVLLTSHIDTVPPHIPYSISTPSPSQSRSSIRINGRGTVDDKACVASQTIATLSLLSTSTISATDIALLFVVSEETTGLGMAHFSNSSLYSSTNSNYKAVLFGEPTEGKLASGHKGITLLKITAEGKAAHSGYPWLGRSANSMILPALFSLDRLGELTEEEGGLPRSKKYGQSTVNVGYMQGGVAANVVPEHAEATVAFRLAGGPIEKVHGIIENAIRGADPEGLLDMVFSQPGYAPVELDCDVDGFDCLTVNYGTDVPNLEVEEGVKRYLYGPGSILVAHGANEGLTVGDLEESVKGYEKLVKHVLGM